MKIKNCPFCGGEARVNERYRGGVANCKMYWVSCQKCWVSQPYGNLAGYSTIDKAIEAWNRESKSWRNAYEWNRIRA